MNNQVTVIKPKVLIKMLEESFPEENIVGEFLMPPSYIGSLTLLESAMLLAFVKLIRPSKVFEFGTFMGHTSVFLARNMDKDGVVYTLDIPHEDYRNESFNSKAQEVDHLLRQQSVEQQAKCIEKEGDEIKSKIVRLLCNSLTFSTSELAKECGLIFIDGGHETEIIESDTQKALEMLGEGGVVVWHDYNSDIYTDVTKFIDKISLEHSIFHIAHTNMAFIWPGMEAELSALNDLNQ
ncbi:class I SAM-dependent methyltransferase [Pseudoalteromonas piscicida]|uniref:class I SAM-dependent methyltransferase n=1 Tax=Pseudoalteromonas TaxID=53246 RepID=UPI0027E54CDC|nr:class I SAM-dependent methyltransferase [Pseudoalteromonas piscicida]WMO14136.1 class I SAM-dependent methyltransferase [Pseudoalteromonas piscicida]